MVVMIIDIVKAETADPVIVDMTIAVVKAEEEIIITDKIAATEIMIVVPVVLTIIRLVLVQTNLHGVKDHYNLKCYDILIF